MDNYFGTYAIATPSNKDEAAKLLNSDNVIGDIYDVVCENENGKHVAYVLNRFNDKPAFFKPDLSRTLAINEAAGMTTKAFLTLVGFTEGANEETNYWAQFAIVSYPASKEEIYSAYVKKISESFKSGHRPEVKLTNAEVEELEQAKGDWISGAVNPLPKKEKGTAFLKTQVSITDKLVEQGRKKNPGCYIGGWAFMLIVVALFVFITMKILGMV